MAQKASNWGLALARFLPRARGDLTISTSLLLGIRVIGTDSDKEIDSMLSVAVLQPVTAPNSEFGQRLVIRSSVENRSPHGGHTHSRWVALPLTVRNTLAGLSQRGQFMTPRCRCRGARTCRPRGTCTCSPVPQRRAGSQ